MSTNITAAQRGTDWIRQYSCPTWCVMNHAADGAPGWHHATTADVTAVSPGANALPGDPLDVLLSARVTQMSDDPEAFGVETRIWFDTGYDTYEIDVAQTDRLINGLENFLPKLRAMREHLAQVSAGDHPGDPAAKARSMARMDAQIKAVNEGTVTHP